MNGNCVDLVLEDPEICLLCKAWFFFFARVLSNEQFRRWEGSPAYPYRDKQGRFHEMFELPEVLNSLSEEDEEIFWENCDYWFDACVTHNQQYHIHRGLPHSNDGLGIVSRVDACLKDLQDSLFGVLEFIDKDTFYHLQSFGFISLFKNVHEGYAVMYGPLSLCNTGDTFPDSNNWPFMEDSDINDTELMFQPEIQTGSKRQYNFVQMHLEGDLAEKTVKIGDQIFIKYAPKPRRVVKRTRDVVDLT